ncbi:E3 ubiquitin-protein ligase TRIM62 isoform X1 [Acipenser ruthenus]|uniref:E3 ubiquitin-protein ligase TRIM62 isoform X1 n=2 Tax=Acipenser ruthenus TaxID=7906 RepID=UPI00145A9CFB|nr:E3 ubiquitin-protein ligase TRIM62 isoform X1 [Acipenser ruthenus]
MTMAEKEQEKPLDKDPEQQCGVSTTAHGNSAQASNRIHDFNLQPQHSSECNDPFPRSPKLGRAATGRNLEARLSHHLEELSAEKARTEAHIRSLKKRSLDLRGTADLMKQQISERYDTIRKALHRDEQATLETIEEDNRVTSGRLNKVIKGWSEHLAQVQKEFKNIQKSLEQTRAGYALQDISVELSYHKKTEIGELGIQMNESRIQRLLKILQNISKDLEAQLKRKSFLLDYSTVTFDQNTSHKNLMVSKDQTSMCFTSEPQPAADNPLQFDKVCSALGTTSWLTGRHYWEVDVKCCSDWSVGIAYRTIERKGKLKTAKLGRNRHSWCIELRDNQLSAWHNDRHISCGIRHPTLHRVGVFVDYEKGLLAFYNASTMKPIQEISCVTGAVFDRMRHHFTEPVLPAFRLFPSHSRPSTPDHIEICTLDK